MSTEKEVESITLTLEDGTEEECLILEIFTIEELGDQEYIALLSIPEGLEESEEEELETEISLYRYTELEDEEISLDIIDDPEEAEIVEAAFQALMDAEGEDEE